MSNTKILVYEYDKNFSDDLHSKDTKTNLHKIYNLY